MSNAATAGHDRVDPQMRPQLEQLLSLVGPRGFHGIVDLDRRRERYSEVMSLAAARAPDGTRVTREDVSIRLRRDRAPLDVRLYRPAAMTEKLPGLIYIHGGGFIMGSVIDEDPFAATLAEYARCVVASVAYGLAPENPGTGPVEDCYDALCWLHRHAASLGVDRRRLALYGASAGGGLACGTALLARDRGGPALVHQMLLYPMLDDRTAGLNHAVIDLGIWDCDANREAWHHLLKDSTGTDGVSAYAAPGRATDLRGLPPTYLDVGDLDLFLDEDLELVQRLARAEVPVEVHVYAGAYHGFDQLAPGSDTAATAQQQRLEALRRALSECSPQVFQPEGR